MVLEANASLVRGEGHPEPVCHFYSNLPKAIKREENENVSPGFGRVWREKKLITLFIYIITLFFHHLFSLFPPKDDM